MISLDDRARAALAAGFPWFAALDPQPDALASVDRPRPGALHFVGGSRAGVVLPAAAVAIVGEGAPWPCDRCVEVEHPRRTFAAITRILRDARHVDDMTMTASGAWVSATASIGAKCRIETGAIVGPGVTLGDSCTIEAGAVLRAGVTLGPRCRVLSSAVVGADGYGYAMVDGAPPEPIAHLGGVEIGADVDICAGALVSAGTIDPTRIGDGAKIEGNAYVGHNAEIGRRTMVCANAVVGGSVVVGDDVWINPGALLKTKIRVGDRAKVGLGAVVMRDVAAQQQVMGDTAQDIRKRLRRDAAITKLLSGPRRQAD